VLDAVLAAKLNHRTTALSREPGFEAAGLVVYAGMNHAAVPPGLMTGQAGLLFQDEDSQPGFLSAQGYGRRQPHDASTDDRTINHIDSENPGRRLAAFACIPPNHLERYSTTQNG